MTQQLTQRMPSAPAAAAPEVSRKPFAAHPVQLDRDRRAGVERVIELARWAVLVYAAVGKVLGPDGDDVRIGIADGAFTARLASRQTLVVPAGESAASQPRA